MLLVPKNWKSFQHYKDRQPPWVKLHKSLLDDRDFARLPLASKALAPMLWLLASESLTGEFDGSVEELSFRLRWSEKDISAGLKPLIDKGLFIVASTMLADCLHLAVPETETETETETEKPKKARKAKTTIPEDFGISDSVKAWALKNGHTQLEVHLEKFINSCQAKGYEYQDWDSAFRNAISSNWAKVSIAIAPAQRIRVIDGIKQQFISEQLGWVEMVGVA